MDRDKIEMIVVIERRSDITNEEFYDSKFVAGLSPAMRKKKFCS